MPLSKEMVLDKIVFKNYRVIFRLRKASLLFACSVGTFAAQHKVDPANSYHRLIAVVPLVGKGTYDDPKHPMYAPIGKRIAGNRVGIIAYSQQLSDDKKSAIVEFVAVDRAAFNDILNDKTVKVFEKGKNLKAEIELELKKSKKDFDLTNFQVLVR